MEFDADGDRWIQKLRFPLDMEREFLAHHSHQSQPWLRSAAARLGLVILFYIFLRTDGLTGIKAMSVGLAADIFTPILALLGLRWLSGRPRAARFWPLAAGGVCCLLFYLALSQVLRMMGHPPADAAERGLVTFLPCLLFQLGYLSVTAFLFRWRLAEMALYGCGLTLIAMRLPVAYGFTGIVLSLAAQTLIVLPVFGCLINGCYLLERSARTEFLAGWLLEKERARSEALLRNVLPAPIAERLKSSPESSDEIIADDFAAAGVLFADVEAFSSLSALLPPAELVRLLNSVFSAFDALADRYGLEKIKTIGDAYMVAAGVPIPREESVEALADMAFEMHAVAAGFRRPDGTPLRLRIGMHVGPVVAGVLGTRRFLFDLWGETVNIASRMESHGAAGTTQVTAAVYEKLHATHRFSAPYDLGVKGYGVMTLYRLSGRQDNSKQSDETKPR